MRLKRIIIGVIIALVAFTLVAEDRIDFPEGLPAGVICQHPAFELRTTVFVAIFLDGSEMYVYRVRCLFCGEVLVDWHEAECPEVSGLCMARDNL